METITLRAGTVMTCIRRHCTILLAAIDILERMVETTGDESLVDMLNLRCQTLDSLTAYGDALVDSTIRVADTYGCHPVNVPLEMSRDQWLMVAPPVPTEWEYRDRP